jgi:hypothetical protein
MNDNDEQRGRVLKFRAKRRRAAYPAANDDELDALANQLIGAAPVTDPEAVEAFLEELARESPQPVRDEEFYREALRLTAMCAELPSDSGEPRDDEE